MADPPPEGVEVLREVWRPGAIGALRLPHRIVMGSMHLGVEGDDDAGAALAAFYGERARGGAGLIVTGGTAVSRAGAGGTSYGFVNEDAGARALATVPLAVHAEGGRVALQLFHAGRYAFEEAFGLKPVAPSAVPSRLTKTTPAALDEDGILAILDAFARGATRAVELGFDAVEVMGSEGYLVDQFLSPLTNLRDDAWGGDAERRRRFGIELALAVRNAVGPRFPVIFRFTGADLMPGSTSLEEATAFGAALAAAGADALNVGIGWHESRVPTVQGAVPPLAWAACARAVRAAAPDVPVIAGNRIDTLSAAERLLADGAADFASMARPFLADPALVAATRARRPVNVCIACNQACIDRSIGDGRVSCMVNPRAGHERAFVERRGGARTPTVAVVGGGPAGMEAARALAALGARVELFEAEAELGGQFRLARLVPGKAQFGHTIAYFAAELARLGVTVHLGQAVTAGAALADFDAVVLATGVTPRAVDLPGRDLPHVLDYPRAFAAGAVRGRVAILGAGGIGVDLAHRLSHRPLAADPVEDFQRRWGLAGDGDGPAAPGAHITLMRRAGRVGAGMGRSTRWVSVEALRQAGVRTRTGVAYERIAPEGVWIAAEDGTPELVAADTVVVAAGQEPRAELQALVAALGRPWRAVGGARDAVRLDAVRAFSEGLAAAHELARALGLRAS